MYTPIEQLFSADERNRRKTWDGVIMAEYITVEQIINAYNNNEPLF